MKYILTAFFIFYLLTKVTVAPVWDCNIRTIFQAIPPILWYEQTTDGQNQPPLVTRFFHNKVNIFSSQFSKCYAHFLEPIEVYRAGGIMGLFFWLYAIYIISINKIKWLIVLFLLAPLIQIFRFDPKFIDFSYKLFAMIGFGFFLQRIK